MKKVLFLLFASLLVLGACGNNESDSQSSNKEELTAENQEKIQKKELRKLGKQITKTMNTDTDDTSKDIDSYIKDLDKAIKDYENKTKNLDQVDITISEPLVDIGKSVLVGTKQLKHIHEFKKDNPKLKETYELASGNLYFHLYSTLESINMEYEDIDAEYKNSVLGKELSSDIADLLYSDYDLMDFAGAMGEHTIEYSETLTSDQIKQLNQVDFRTELYKLGDFDEPDVSKKEYNQLVEYYNKLSPEFLHYKKVNEMVSTDELNIMMDMRNGVVGADTDREASDYEDDMEEEDTDLAEKEDEQEVDNPAREQVIKEGIDMDNPTDAEIERMRELAKDSPHGLQSAPSQGGYK